MTSSASASPRALAAAVRRHDRRRHADQQDGAALRSLRQMPEPRYVISWGRVPMAAALSLFLSVVRGCVPHRADRHLCAGLPPTAEALLYGLLPPAEESAAPAPSTGDRTP